MAIKLEEICEGNQQMEKTIEKLRRNMEEEKERYSRELQSLTSNSTLSEKMRMEKE